MRYLLICITLFTIKNASAQNYDVNAYVFHHSILDAQASIGNEMYEFNKSATLLNLKILKFEIKKSIQFLDSLKIYNNETAYYNATRTLFNTYKEIADIDFPQLLKYVEDPELGNEDFKAKKNGIFDNVKNKMQLVFPPFEDAQKQFCIKYKLQQ
ncbi:MAG: hypothetical protein R2739_07955 [Chitinophagales bacterium]|nr:hypothetical protein [Bacteroidota bacterium]